MGQFMERNCPFWCVEISVMPNGITGTKIDKGQEENKPAQMNTT